MSDRLFPVDAVKRCCTCHLVLPLTDFNRLRRSKDGRQPSCRVCNSAYHYENWRRHIAQVRARTTRRRDAARAFIVDYLRTHPCVDCGEDDLMVLEFDHLRDKRANVSSLIGSSEIWRVEEEIAKCEVVCANCHRRRTARRSNTYRYRASES